VSVRFGDCVFDAGARTLWRAGRVVPLSPKALELLGLLVASRPRPLSQAHLRDALWPKTHVGYTSLARVVSEVRKAVGESARRASVIRTVPRFGYAFTLAPAEAPGAGSSPGTCALLAGDHEFVLPEGEVLVGRGPECGVRLPSAQVSRLHAAITVVGGRATVADRDSKNGVWVNGTRVTSPVELRDGDELSFGAYRARFLRADALTSTKTGAPR
jgi:DNA-binding winged helix-turn-helix (wHTH) protein